MERIQEPGITVSTEGLSFRHGDGSKTEIALLEDICEAPEPNLNVTNALLWAVFAQLVRLNEQISKAASATGDASQRADDAIKKTMNALKGHGIDLGSAMSASGVEAQE